MQEQQQRLQQRLNPQYVALGRLLEMSVAELEEEIRSRLNDNPALEVVSPSSGDEHAQENDFHETSEQLQQADYASEDDMPISSRPYSHRADGYEDFDPTSIAADDGVSLYEAVMSRLESEYEMSDTDRRIAAYIIGNFDESGYLTRSLSSIADDIAIAEGFEPRPEEMNRVFSLIRTLDPPGLGAVDLRDALLLQLDAKKASVTQRTAREIVANYFDLLSKKHYSRLVAQLEISEKNLSEALDLIKSLNPKPASALSIGASTDRVRHVNPDISLEYDNDTGIFTISLLGNIPELGIEESFTELAPIEKPSANAAVRQRQRQALAFKRRKYDDASAFIGLLRMRAETMMKIVKTIVDIQRTFFITGEKADIRPMILRDISERTGLDLSVISRATADKYILTTHGVYPLKLFFNERPDAESDVSSHEIIKAIQTIIDAEDKHSPMSDQAIADALVTRGYDIARRTVAKYRERLGLPVARLRRNL